MTEKEAVESLKNTNATLVKIGQETDRLLAEIENLKQQLANAGGTGGTITPELEAAVKAVADQAAKVDALVPDLEVEPPEAQSK